MTQVCLILQPQREYWLPTGCCGLVIVSLDYLVDKTIGGSV
jgi:hypothetical protein